MIRNIAGRGFGPGASVAFVVTRGFVPTAPAPNASLATRGFGRHGSIARLVTRYYGIKSGTAVAEASGTWHERYSARKFYALREKIEEEREELRLAIAQIERKKRTLGQTGADNRAGKSASSAFSDAYKSTPQLGEGIDITALARDITQAAHSAARLRQMEQELVLAAQMLEAELQDEDDLILVLAF